MPNMKLMQKYLQAIIALMICSSALAQTPQAVSDAIKKLRDASNYTWTVTTELPGAPFEIAPITGTTDTNGFVMLKSEAGKNVVVAKGEARVLKTSSGWKSVTVLGSDKDPAALDLLTTKTPPDELAALTAKLNEIKSAGDNSFTGTFDTASAKAYLQSSMEARPGPGGKTPDTKNASGKFQLWLKDGLPQKYTLTINAELSLPFGTKDVTRIGTTEIKDIGNTKVEVPKEARQVLEK